MTMQLRHTHSIHGAIEILTGLHIGVGKETVEIGGLDSPVIRHPHTQHPYIPGSSLKGKLRSLLEWALNCIEPDGAVFGSRRNYPYPQGNPILRIFGCSNDTWKEGPARIIVRDAHLQKDWLNRILTNDLPLTEEKQEVTIDRIQGKAASMGPRTIERIPAGALLDLEILFREYDLGDDGKCDRQCLARLLEAMRLLEQDALGGSGSRGYGKIRFRNLTLNQHPIQDHFQRIRSLKPDAPAPELVQLVEDSSCDLLPH